MLSTTRQLANAVIEAREGLIVDAITHVLGRDNWTFEDVRDRGTLTYYGPNECLFLFDGRPLLELYMTLNFQVHDEHFYQFHHTKYRKLYDEKELNTASDSSSLSDGAGRADGQGQCGRILPAPATTRPVRSGVRSPEPLGPHGRDEVWRGRT